MPRKVRDLKVPQTDDPVLTGMNAFEKELFMQVMGASIQAIHSSKPINLAKSLEIYFRDCLKTSIYLSGMAVDEYRKLQVELKQNNPSKHSESE